MKFKKSNNKGFTLVELIIVVAIIAILASVLVPQYGRYVESARQSSDLQMASNIIKAVKTAIADESSNIPAGHFIEILWIVGDESVGVTDGSILIRNNDEYRTSIFNDNKGTDDLPRTEGPNGYLDTTNLTDFAHNVFATLGTDGDIFSDRPGWLQMRYNDAESELGNAANFAIHVSTTTGEVALAATPSATLANPNRWIDVGLNITPHPDYPYGE